MSDFKRGIKNRNFITELNNNCYFQKMVEDEDLFIAIRNEYINVYYYGQSVCKIEFKKRENKIKWTTHNKYLGKDKGGYFTTTNGDFLNQIDDLKCYSYNHAKEEKIQVKKHILEDKELCILDVEVTFGREQDYGKRSIDFVIVEKTADEKIKLVFYEAKHFDNSEIRANETPKVIGQIEKYEKVLNDPDHQVEILNSYKNIFENIKALNLNNNRKLVDLIGVNNQDLEIDTKPRLIIFEIDQDKKEDVHLKKLSDRFNNKRLILKYKKLAIDDNTDE